MWVKLRQHHQRILDSPDSAKPMGEISAFPRYRGKSTIDLCLLEFLSPGNIYGHIRMDLLDFSHFCRETNFIPDVD